MASTIDICNLALSNLGDTATIASIDPPEGSAQSEHCARFYPAARDALLELHDWAFSIRRVALARLDITITQWTYVYAMPNLVVGIISIIPPDATNDYSSMASYPSQYGYNPSIIPAAGYYVPQPFAVEILEDGTQVICTNQENAVLRYTKVVTDPAQFSPLFVLLLSWLLSSMLAGPLLKGDAGAAESKRCLGIFQGFLNKATESDASHQKAQIQHIVSFMAAR